MGGFMDTRSLQVYLALADTLSFSRVAQQQQPAVV
jgi:DNA-binding transcriptional LysR family regulator